MAAYYEEFINPLLPAKNAFIIRIEHLGRYLFARKFLQQHTRGVVYDVACGDGYGTRLLAKETTKIFGFDTNAQFLSTAKHTSTEKNISYFTCDLEYENICRIQEKHMLPKPDTIVCFETIEHIRDAHILLQGFYEVLLPGGYVILSTPNALLEPKKYGISKNIFHKKIYEKEEIKLFLEQQGFVIEHVYGQPATNIFFHKSRFFMHVLNKITERSSFLIYHFTCLLGMPTEENFARSYAMIFVARKKLLQ